MKISANISAYILTSVYTIHPPSVVLCDCRFCSGHKHDIKPVPLSEEVKYLGVYLGTLSSNRKV